VSSPDARPFYESFGWAYDLLVDDRVEPWVGEVCATAGPAARILDAGCGTGRHAQALAARGHSVFLVDRSPTLLGLARERLPEAEWAVADLRDLDLGRSFEIVACRGVLNDLVHDEDRRAAVRALAAQVEPGGQLVLDVRDRGDTLRRYRDGLRREVRRNTSRGELLFVGEGCVEGELIRVHERHELRARDGNVVRAEHDFVMRPWMPDEIRSELTRAGLIDVTIEPAADVDRSGRRWVRGQRPRHGSGLP
jgi:glycine/sarcosine N-methyltransferase